MIEQSTLFTKDNVAILISIIGIIFTGLTYFNNIRKMKFDHKKELNLGAVKLKEILLMLKKLQNIDPTNLTFEKYTFDKMIFESIIQKYNENETKIENASYAIPYNIIEIKDLLKKIEDNYNEIYQMEHLYNHEIELVINYSQLFFFISLLAYPVNAANLLDKPYSEKENFKIYFEGLWLKFQDYKYKVVNYKIDIEMQQLYQELKALKNQAL